MKYARGDAKAYANANMKGIWAAALTPFIDDGRIDEDGFLQNVRHWTEDLHIAGLFVCGKQGEFFSMSLDERKRCLELAVEAAGSGAQTMMSCSDQNLDVVLDLAHHAQSVGADYIVVHAPTLHFVHEHDETVYRYYETISQSVDVGMALWSHPDSGYLMSPQLCDRLADLDNVVAIKYSVPRPMYAELTALASDRIQVSTASEGRMARQHPRARLEALPVLVAALPAAGGHRPANARLHPGGVRRGCGRGPPHQREPQPGARRPEADQTPGEAPRPPEVLAGAARTGRRPRPRAASGADRRREGGHP